MRVATGTAHAMTVDAKPLAGTAVTSGARRGIDARLNAVLAAPGTGADPARWMRIMQGRAGSHVLRQVAIAA